MGSSPTRGLVENGFVKAVAEDAEATSEADEDEALHHGSARAVLIWFRSANGQRFLGWLAILIPLLVWAAAMWPAVMVADSKDSWNQAVVGPVNEWHKPTYTYVQRLSHVLVGSPWGVTVLQCGLMAWAVRRLLDVAVLVGARRWLLYGFGAFVALTPPVGAFTVQLIKDVPYAIAFLVVMEFVGKEVAARYLHRSAQQDHMIRRTILLFLGLAGLALMRQNGSLVLVGSAVAAVFVSRHWRLAAAAGFSALVLSITLSSLVYPAVGVVESPQRSSSAPFGLAVRTLFADRPEDVPEYVVPSLELHGSQAEYAELYNCHWAGSEFQPRLYQPKPVDRSAIRRAWFEAFRDDPLFITGAHLCAASPAWNPIATEEEQAYYQTVWDVVVENPQGLVSDPLSDLLGDYARRLLRFVGLTNHSDKAWNPVVSQLVLWRAPTYVYLLAAGLLVAGIRYGRWRALWLLVPFVAQAASVIILGGPHYRYMAPAWIGSVLLLPLAWKLSTRGRLGQRIIQTDPGAGTGQHDASACRGGHSQRRLTSTQ